MIVPQQSRFAHQPQPHTPLDYLHPGANVLGGTNLAPGVLEAVTKVGHRAPPPATLLGACNLRLRGAARKQRGGVSKKNIFRLNPNGKLPLGFGEKGFLDQILKANCL